jgi:hypothetical protein
MIEQRPMVVFIPAGCSNMRQVENIRYQGLEVVLKPDIRFKGKASGRSGKRSIHEYVSIYRRPVLHPNL